MTTEQVSTPQSTSRLLRADDIAEWLNLPVDTVYEHARRKLLPCVRIGRSVRFRQQDIEAFVDKGGSTLPGGWRAVSSGSLS